MFKPTFILSGTGFTLVGIAIGAVIMRAFTPQPEARPTWNELRSEQKKQKDTQANLATCTKDLAVRHNRDKCPNGFPYGIYGQLDRIASQIDLNDHSPELGEQAGIVPVVMTKAPTELEVLKLLTRAEVMNSNNWGPPTTPIFIPQCVIKDIYFNGSQFATTIVCKDNNVMIIARLRTNLRAGENIDALGYIAENNHHATMAAVSVMRHGIVADIAKKYNVALKELNESIME